MNLRLCVSVSLWLLTSASRALAETPPREWVDSATGHRIIRLSDEGGTASLYFHQNPYTASGDKMVVTTPSGLSTIDLHTRRIEPLVAGRVSGVVVGKNFNVSQDGKLFAGDGGGPQSVAAPGNGQWIYLFMPKNGAVNGEKLVDLTSHDYGLEPNVTFTPDRKWIVFRSNIFGETHVYAVEVEKK
jgi:hypothetical protein